MDYARTGIGFRRCDAGPFSEGIRSRHSRQAAQYAIRRMAALGFTITHYCLIIRSAIDASTHHIMAINDGLHAPASMTKPANFA